VEFVDASAGKETATSRVMPSERVAVSKTSTDEPTLCQREPTAHVTFEPGLVAIASSGVPLPRRRSTTSPAAVSVKDAVLSRFVLNDEERDPCEHRDGRRLHCVL